MPSPLASLIHRPLVLPMPSTTLCPAIPAPSSLVHARAICQPVQSVQPCLVPAPVCPRPSHASAFPPPARVRTLNVVHAIYLPSPMPLALHLSSSTPIPSSTPCLA